MSHLIKDENIQLHLEIEANKILGMHIYRFVQAIISQECLFYPKSFKSFLHTTALRIFSLNYHSPAFKAVQYYMPSSLFGFFYYSF